MMCMVDVHLPDGSLPEALDSAGGFAYRTLCVARFVRGEFTYKVWYAAEGWRATRESPSGIEQIERDHGRWGRFQETA